MFKRLFPLVFAAVVAVGAFGISGSSPKTVSAEPPCDYGYTAKSYGRIFRYNVINTQSVAVQGDNPDDRGYATAFKMTGSVCYNGIDAYANGGQVVSQVGINPNLFIRSDGGTGAASGPFWATILLDNHLTAQFWYTVNWQNLNRGYTTDVKMKFIVNGQGNVSFMEAKYVPGPNPDCGIAGCFPGTGTAEFTLNQYDWD